MPRRRPSLLLIALLLGLGRPAAAQLLRGSVRSASTSLGVADAQVTVRDTTGQVVAVTMTDRDGRWALRIRRRSEPLSVHARRVGFAIATTEPSVFSPTDTVDLEFLLTEVVATMDEMRVTGMVPLNEQRLTHAYRRGWRVYEPELVAQHRERAADLNQLIRAVGVPSLILPRRADECIRQARTNQCIAVVVDGQVLGTSAFVLPADVYFFAVLQPAESRVEYGPRAPGGAIAIYTRMRGDRAGPPPR